jgi:uncharacterized protein (TIGR03067 family)
MHFWFRVSKVCVAEIVAVAVCEPSNEERMMMRVYSLAILLALLISSVQLNARDKDAGSDVERLQGTWIPDLEPDLQGRLTLDGSRLRFVHVNGKRETLIWDGHFAINEKAEPKQMDWTPLRRSGREVPTSLAIYQLDGDNLLIIGNTEGPRPAAFYSGGGSQRPKTIIFRRAKSSRAKKIRNEDRAD